MARYEVVVGNVGTVYAGDDAAAAQAAFDEYLNQSIHGHGRAQGEPVTMFEDGEVIREFSPVLHRVALCKARSVIANTKLTLARAFLAERRLVKLGTDYSFGVEEAAVRVAQYEAHRAKAQLRIAIEEASDE